MHPGFEKRLSRVRLDARIGTAMIGDRRATLEAEVAVGALLRSMLAERGVDPEQVKALRRLDRAAAELATLPERTAAEVAEETNAAAHTDTDGENPIELLLHRLARLAAVNLADGRRPDLDGSAPAEWLAWCLVTPAADG
jgi:hypothetical protein